MNNLYELSNGYEEVINMLYQDDIDEQMIFDTLESIEGDMDDKIENVAKIIREVEAKSNAHKEEGQKQINRSKVLDNRVKTLKTSIYNAMKTMGKSKLSTNLFDFSIAKNGGKQALTIDSEVSAEYTKTVVENDTDKIRQALEEGKKLPFAHLEPRGERLSIK